MCSENSPHNGLNKRRIEKRHDYLEWDEYFMGVAFLELKRRTRTNKGDAAIVLNHRQIIIGIDHCSVEDNTTEDSFKYHPEYKLSKITKGVVMYTTSFPCEKCAEAIAASGISEVVYYEDINNDKAKELLSKAQVTFRQFESKREKIEIDFSKFYDDAK